MSSVLQETADPFTVSNLPKLSRSPMVNPGSVARFDFTDAYTLNGLANGAAIPDATVLRNLVEGGTGLTATGLSGSVSVASDGKGLVATGGAATTSYLQPGYGEWDMYERGNHDFIWHVWANLDASGQSAAVSIIEGRSGQVGNVDTTSPLFGATPSPTTLANGADGFTYNGFTRSGAVTGTASMAAGGVPSGSAHLVSYAHIAGQNSIYLDGVLKAANSAAPSIVPSFRSHATLTASGNVSAGDGVTLNGSLIAYVASGAVGAQVNVGSNAAESLANLMAYINAHSSTLNARAEITTGQAATVLSIFRTNAAALTLTETAANLAASSITSPYGYRFFARRMKGKIYALALDDLTVMGATAAEAAAREFALYRPRLTALGIA